MNDILIRAFVRQVIAEAKAKKEKKAEPKKKEEKLPKSSGKLMDLKKEIAYLKEMSEQLQATGLTEGEQVTEVEFSNLQKFVNELNKIKEAGASLKAKLEEEITATEAKIKSEKNKIKEMIGLVSEKSTDTSSSITENKETVKTKYGNLSLTQDEDGEWEYSFKGEKGGVKQGIVDGGFSSKEAAIKDFEAAMSKKLAEARFKK